MKYRCAWSRVYHRKTDLQPAGFFHLSRKKQLDRIKLGKNTVTSLKADHNSYKQESVDTLLLLERLRMCMVYACYYIKY